MAKKKKPKISNVASAVDGSAEVTPVGLAWQVASVVNLRQVLVEEINARRTREGFVNLDEWHLNPSIDTVEFGRPVNGETLIVRITFALRALRKDETEIGTPKTEIVCKFVLLYDVPGLGGFSDDALGAFAQTSGVFNAWPYWRELVHSMTMRMALPPVVLPSHRVVPVSDATVGDGRSQ